LLFPSFYIHFTYQLKEDRTEFEAKTKTEIKTKIKTKTEIKIKTKNLSEHPTMDYTAILLLINFFRKNKKDFIHTG